ncbi:uncharacterized protein DUF1127 [Hoeflea halophila]|uniref:Uncharacterized protein DUF1127 n=1 Tax=Hoeflea halophila TaxID=714899 RepID=A0A286IE41_9HYPH|nr:DUF1127 domain-containing protein [Hoeflea halophila]SOE18388.1 uncharacterized protein DUF1127 [Hoeflea halophila]
MNSRSLTAARPAVRTLSFGSALQNILFALVGKSRGVTKALFNRRVAHRLDQLSDRELSDIGLTRDDLRYGFSMPLTTDPTVELARRARLNSHV